MIFHIILKIYDFLYDFKDIPCDVKANLIDSYCMCTDPSYGIIANMMFICVILHRGNQFDGVGKFLTPHTVIYYHPSSHQF